MNGLRIMVDGYVTLKVFSLFLFMLTRVLNPGQKSTTQIPLVFLQNPGYVRWRFVIIESSRVNNGSLKFLCRFQLPQTGIYKL